MPDIPQRGVFWVIDNQLLAFPFTGSPAEGIAKSGNTYHHKKLWPFVAPAGCGKPYNYYPRGRVEITRRDQAIIYMNPHISATMIPLILSAFQIDEKARIVYDCSQHYRCHLDAGWKPD